MKSSGCSYSSCASILGVEDHSGSRGEEEYEVCRPKESLYSETCEVSSRGSTYSQNLLCVDDDAVFDGSLSGTSAHVPLLAFRSMYSTIREMDEVGMSAVPEASDYLPNPSIPQFESGVRSLGIEAEVRKQYRD